MGEDKEVIVLTDDNIDSSENNRHNSKYNIQMLYNILNDHLNENSIKQLNRDFTRITSHQQPACLNKIYTNKPNKFSNIRTCKNIDLDHKYVIARYMTCLPSTVCY